MLIQTALAAPHSTARSYTLNRCLNVHTVYVVLVASCKDGDLRLRGGESDASGRLEFCDNNQWATIQVDGWSSIDTKVACELMNFSSKGIEQYMTLCQLSFKLIFRC